VGSVAPGASGQSFLPGTPKRIKTLANTRAKYGFNYRISVDGGINPDTAQLCWAAGADWLVSGSFLHDAPDFADAVAKLLPKR
jgi:ribulose-phosphate 3-epimerase